MNLTNPIYTNEEEARLHLENIRWGSEKHCPHCGSCEKIKETPMRNKITSNNEIPDIVHGYYHCGACRKRFTVRTGTIYERSHIPLHKWILATHLVCSSKKGMSAHQLHRMLGITYKTAWFMSHRIREAMNETNPPPIGNDKNPVQADETYFGTREEITKRTKRGKASHSSKMSVVTLISGGKSRTFHVETANVISISRILNENVRKEAELHTDESRLYKSIGQEFSAHKTVRHSAGEYVRDGAHVNNCENYFSIFKRGMRGVYQHCSEKHLQRYLNEFDYRYNTRDMTDFERAEKLQMQIEGKRLTYKATKISKIS